MRENEAWHFLFILAFIPSDGRTISQLYLIRARSHLPPKKELRLPDHLFVQIMFVRSRSIASTASCLSRDRRSYRSSLIAEKSRSTRTCVTGSAASTWLQLHRSRLGWDDVPRISFLKNSTESGKVINGGSRERALGAVEFQRGIPISEE